MIVCGNMLNIVLEDDDTPNGGVAFAGETIGDFLEELECSNITIEELNERLKECGIKEVVCCE